MTPEQGPNAGQRDYWNSDVGRKWTDNADVLDAAFVEVTQRVIERAGIAPGERVLDIGCGGGATTLAAAGRVGPGGEVAGLDISAPLVALARARLAAAGASQAHVELCDAQTEPLAASRYDAAISRFGVMFFADPVAAFANIRGALKPGGRIAFAAWAPLEENPWFDLPRGAAVARLGPVAPSPPREPGPMAFAEADHFAAVLAQAGFADVAIAREDVTLHHAGPVLEAARLLAGVGPAARIVREHNGSEADVAAILSALAASLAPYAADGAVRIPGRLNVASGRR